MSKIFEIFGYPTDDSSIEATNNRQAARCPFMGRECDGGGNRYLSSIIVKGNPSLEAFFGDREKVCAGVCSLQLTKNMPPWIVCPRRLLVLGREVAGARIYQKKTEEQTLKLLGYAPGTRLGVWPEVKIKYEENVEGIIKTFDYTFDYILMPLVRLHQTDIEQLAGKVWTKLQPLFKKGGYTISTQGDDLYVEDCPSGIPSIVEIMTSSTSGGNKDKGTTISAALKNAIEGQPYSGPVLTIVKYGREWLANSFKNPQSVIELSNGRLFAGLITTGKPEELIAPDSSEEPATTQSFHDIIRAPLRPSLGRLIEILAQRKPENEVIAP